MVIHKCFCCFWPQSSWIYDSIHGKNTDVEAPLLSLWRGAVKGGYLHVGILFHLCCCKIHPTTNTDIDKIGQFQSVTSLLSLANLLKRRSWSASSARILPEYYFLHGNLCQPHQWRPSAACGTRPSLCTLLLYYFNGDITNGRLDTANTRATCCTDPETLLSSQIYFLKLQINIQNSISLFLVRYFWKAPHYVHYQFYLNV